MSISMKSLYDWYRNTLRNPKYRWWLILGSLIYLLSPFDISPDFIPIVGWLDDGVIVGLLVAEVSQMLLEKTNKGKNQPESSDRATEKTEAVDVDAVTLEK